MSAIEEQISAAFQHHAAGDLAKAGEQYAALLNQYPENPQLLYLFGTLRYQLGDLSRAHKFLEDAIAAEPRNVQARINFSLVLQDEKRFEDAQFQLDKAIQFNPNAPEIHNNLAALLFAMGQIEEAKKSCLNALNLRQDYPDALNNLGMINKTLADLKEAELCFQKAIAVNSDYAEALGNLGALFCEQKRYAEAIEFLQRATSLAPLILDPHLNLARAFICLKRLKEAEVELNFALQLNPTHSGVLELKVDILGEEGRFAEAQATAFTLLAHDPNNATVLYKLASSLFSVNLIDEAQRVLNKAEGIDSESALSNFYRGFFLLRLNKLEEALEQYNIGLTKDPENATAYWNRGLVYLLLEKFKEGFEDFEWRFHPNGVLNPHQYLEPQWDGRPLHGEGVLVHGEQGFGDILQFMRYIKHVQERDGHVIFNSGQAVYKLLVEDDQENNTQVKESAIDSTADISYKTQIPLLSLPKVFDTAVNTVPWDGPYVHALEKRLTWWKERLSNQQGFKIGIVWAGNPDHKNDHNRSCRLSEFSLLSRIPGIRWYALQKGKAALGQITSLVEDFQMEVLDAEIKDFSDTAAAIANFDLVISVDTSVTHLAGAMEIPVWTLIPFNPDWRWMMKRQDSPWYPSMRLFRQKHYGDWPSVFEQVHDSLLPLLQAHRHQLHQFDVDCLDAYIFSRNRQAEKAIERYLRLLNGSVSLSPSIISYCANAAIHDGLAPEILPPLHMRPEKEAQQWRGRVEGALGNKEEMINVLHALQNNSELGLAGYLALGEAHFDSGNFDAAESVFQNAIEKWPVVADLHFHLGRTVQKLARSIDAMVSYKKAIEIDPTHPRASNNLAVLYFGEERFQEATKLLQPVVRANTNFALAWANLGRIYSRLNQYDLAEIYLRRALELSPNMAFAETELGSLLSNVGRTQEAMAFLNSGVEHDVNSANAWGALGLAQMFLGQMEDAEKSLTRSVALNPDQGNSRFSLGWCYLLKGRYDEGWKEYEWRYSLLAKEKQRKSPIPRWDGEDLNGRKLLVFTDQGFGDTIQFIRFLPLVQGGEITLEAQDQLIAILDRCPYVSNVNMISWTEFENADCSKWDLEVPLVSLPRIFKLYEHNLQMAAPYLSTSTDRKQYWADRLSNYDNFRVGIVWAGNPAHHNDRRRSAKLSDFALLSLMPGITLFSLQKGGPAEQAILPKDMSLINLGPELHDFLDTAAVIENLDLVISVDTAVVHLAGALGKPVWTLLPVSPDWRWLLDRHDSPWYPSMRLFRQLRNGDWKELMSRVADALTAEINKRPYLHVE